MARLYSSTEVSQLLAISPASVRRSADEGKLACTRTPGGHRRFDGREVERFRQAQVSLAGLVATWADRFLSLHGAVSVHGALLEERARVGTWWPLALLLGEVDAELARRVVTTEISPVDRLLAVERLQRAIEQCNATVTVGPHAASALLARPEFDHVRLGLALVELCARELGWTTLFVGQVAAEDLRFYLERRAPSAVVLTASRASDATRVEHYVSVVQADCDRLGTPCVFVGDAVGARDRLDAMRSSLEGIAADLPRPRERRPTHR